MTHPPQSFFWSFIQIWGYRLQPSQRRHFWWQKLETFQVKDILDWNLSEGGVLEGVKSSKSRPIDLSNKLVLGAFQYGGNWYTRSVQVTNLNVFSSLMSKEKMKSVTKGGSCGEEGDYLAWGDMEWILLGQTRIETVVGVFDISISHIDYRYIDTFWKYRYR